MPLQSRDDLIAKLHQKKYREAFIASRLSNTLALQIRAMRQDRGWSQAYLAELLGTSQNAVYRLESPQYGKPSLTTLKRLASIFDVGLAVWFMPFSKLVDRVTNLSTEDILVPSFDADPEFHKKIIASYTLQINTTESIRVVSTLQAASEGSSVHGEQGTSSVLPTQTLGEFPTVWLSEPLSPSFGNINKLSIAGTNTTGNMYYGHAA